jgi:superfamily II DNA or RNA helicase
MRGLFDKPELGPCLVTPFPHQDAAVEAARNEFRRGVRRTLICHATGTGKAIIIGLVGRMTIEKGGRVLALAHRNELINQLANTFDLCGVEPGIEQSGQFADMVSETDAVVASVPTLKEPGRLMSFEEDAFNLICIDEAHHAVSPSYKTILSRFPNARVLGLTATPKRGDDACLGGVFETVAHTFSIEDAWEAEDRTGVQYLCDIIPTPLNLGIDLRGLRQKKGDFTDADLDERITPMVAILCNASKQEIGDRQTIAFFPSIRSAQLYAEGMRGLGLDAAAVWGDDPERDSKVSRYRSGEIQVLANMDLISEGFDVPNTSAVLLARPTSSWTLYLQQLGRGTRRGKPDMKAIDPGFLTDKFGLVQPHDLIDSPGLDRELAAIRAELLRETPGLSLKNAIEQAKDEFEQRKARKVYAIRMSIAERKVEYEDQSYSMREAHGNGTLKVGNVPLPTADIKWATEAQIRTLRWLKWDGNAERLSRGRAGFLISSLKKQRDEGKSDLWQRKKMAKKGVSMAEARDMSKEAADQTILGLYEGRREELLSRRAR